MQRVKQRGDLLQAAAYHNTLLPKQMQDAGFPLVDRRSRDMWKQARFRELIPYARRASAAVQAPAVLDRRGVVPDLEQHHYENTWRWAAETPGAGRLANLLWSVVNLYGSATPAEAQTLANRTTRWSNAEAIAFANMYQVLNSVSAAVALARNLHVSAVRTEYLLRELQSVYSDGPIPDRALDMFRICIEEGEGSRKLIYSCPIPMLEIAVAAFGRLEVTNRLLFPPALELPYLVAQLDDREVASILIKPQRGGVVETVVDVLAQMPERAATVRADLVKHSGERAYVAIAEIDNVLANLRDRPCDAREAATAAVFARRVVSGLPPQAIHHIITAINFPRLPRLLAPIDRSLRAELSKHEH